MKKALLICLSILMVPSISYGEHPRITELIRLKQQKLADLEKCAGTTKSLKIAGISTLGLTAVGVAGNIAEASAIKKYDKQIDAADKDIAKAQKELDDKKSEIAKQQALEAEEARKNAEAERQKNMLKNVVEADIADINSKGGTLGDKAIYHGYKYPEQLPDAYRSRFADAVIGFITRCRGLISEETGIKNVSLIARDEETAKSWKQAASNLLSPDYILPDLNEHVFATCTVTECYTDKGFELQDGKCVNKNQTAQETKQDCTTSLSGNSDVEKAEKADANAECKIVKCKGDKKPSDDGKSCVVKSANDQSIDCTSTFANNSDVKKAKKQNANAECKITECNDSNKKPSGDGKSCVVKTQGDQSIDCTGDFANNPDVKKAKKANANAQCKITECKESNKKPSEDGKSCVVKSGSDNQSAAVAGPKDLNGQIILYTRVSDSTGFQSDNYAKAVVEGKLYEVRRQGRMGPTINQKETFRALQEKLNKDYTNYNLVESQKDISVSGASVPAAQSKSVPAVPTTPAEGSDCKSQIPGAKTATINGGACKVKECSDSNKEVVDNRCVDKPTPVKQESSVVKQPENESFFNSTKVNLEEGKKLVEIWGRTKGKNLTYKAGSESQNSFGQDYITYIDSDSNTEYKFEFDSLNKTSDASGRKKIIAQKVCEMLKGSYGSDWSANSLYCENVSCNEWKTLVKSVSQAGGHTMTDVDSEDKCALRSY